MLAAVAAITVALAAFPPSTGVAGTQGRERITVEVPRDGTQTSERTIMVSGISPARRKDPGYVVRHIYVNGRRALIHNRRDGRYRREVVLGVGPNVITARARIYRSWRQDRPTAVVRSTPVVVHRSPVPGDGTGALDLATSYLVTEASDDVYWLCGESEDCQTRPVCVVLSESRADCPVGNRMWNRGWRAWQCGVVVTVRLRGDQVRSGDYPCGGRWQRDPRRHIRPETEPRLRRFTVDEKGAPWLRDEYADPGPHGLPRFDVVRDVFVP
jgi:hypothetical protein